MVNLRRLRDFEKEVNMATRSNRAATGSSKRTVSHRHRDFIKAPPGGGRRHRNRNQDERELFMLHREETERRRHNVETGPSTDHQKPLIRRMRTRKAA